MKTIPLNDYVITMEKISYGGYSLRLTTPFGNSSVFCDESWIYDDIDNEEDSESRLVAITAALRRFEPFKFE